MMIQIPCPNLQCYSGRLLCYGGCDLVVIEAILLESSMVLACSCVMAQIAHACDIRDLRGNSKENSASISMQPAELTVIAVFLLVI